MVTQAWIKEMMIKREPQQWITFKGHNMRAEIRTKLKRKPAKDDNIYDIIYTILSYQQIILEYNTNTNKITINNNRFSNTTSRHQFIIRKATEYWDTNNYFAETTIIDSRKEKSKRKKEEKEKKKKIKITKEIEKILGIKNVR